MTKKDTVKALCKMIITRLENEKLVLFSPKIRQEVSEELYTSIGNEVLSDEDLRERAIKKLHGSVDALNETEISESDQFRSALRIVRSQLGENELNGLYYQRPLRDVARNVAGFFMSSDNIEDVFESDDVLTQRVVEIFQRFNPKELH
jgi:hypothetical protein